MYSTFSDPNTPNEIVKLIDHRAGFGDQLQELRVTAYCLQLEPYFQMLLVVQKPEDRVRTTEDIAEHWYGRELMFLLDKDPYPLRSGRIVAASDAFLCVEDTSKIGGEQTFEKRMIRPGTVLGVFDPDEFDDANPTKPLFSHTFASKGYYNAENKGVGTLHGWVSRGVEHELAMIPFNRFVPYLADLVGARAGSIAGPNE